MKNWLKNLSIAKKMWMLAGFVLLCAMAGEIATLASKRQAMEAEKRLATRHVVEMAVDVARHYESLARSGKMTVADAQAAAIGVIADLRYDNGGNYLWINDMQPRMVMHPMKPELNGQDLTNKKDPNGNACWSRTHRTRRSDTGVA